MHAPWIPPAAPPLFLAHGLPWILLQVRGGVLSSGNNVRPLLLLLLRFVRCLQAPLGLSPKNSTVELTAV